MNKLVVAALLVAVASATSLNEFRSWARKYNKVYTASEEARRFSVFAQNMAEVARLNAEKHGTARFGASKFSDLTNEEFATAYSSGFKATAPVVGEPIVPDKSAVGASEVDYRDWLPPVKNQGQCGSCWAFSAVAGMEGQTYQKNGSVVSLSEQQLVSCDKGFNMGCSGGNSQMAYLYAIEHGMATEASYPYASASGTNPKCKAFTPVAHFVNCGQVNLPKDEKLMSLVKEFGPLSVGVEGSSSVFQQYTGGVLDSTKCGKMVNHAVILLGWGTSPEGTEYWTIRNSWGPDWGEQGYIRLVRGSNMCGLNSQAFTVTARS